MVGASLDIILVSSGNERTAPFGRASIIWAVSQLRQTKRAESPMTHNSRMAFKRSDNRRDSLGTEVGIHYFNVGSHLPRTGGTPHA